MEQAQSVDQKVTRSSARGCLLQGNVPWLVTPFLDGMSCHLGNKLGLKRGYDSETRPRMA